MCALVLLVAVGAVRLSSRSGLPSLLIYLGIGVAMGQDGLVGVVFDDAELTQVIGYAALVVILAEGGLSTKWREIKPALPLAATLSTVGVAVSVGVTATAAHYLVGLDWKQALIIGAVVSSTDAAAVFSVLRRVPLPSKLTGALEAESGFNDAPVVILVVAFSATGPIEHWYILVGEIALELAIGAAIGLAIGWLGAYGLRHVALPASGLYPIAVLAIAVVAYAGGALAHGSGFLAVYLASLVMGNARLPHWPATRGFAEGLGWMAQIGMFVLLGLLVTPHELGDDIVPALVVGLVLTAVARPLSVLVSTAPFRTAWQEKALLSWAGLRGAVPIVLATIPMVAAVPESQRIFNIVFVLVIVYTLVQGPTLPWLAKWLRLGDSELASDLGVESAPLERLRGHLLSLVIPKTSLMHGVEVGELRLPAGAAVTLVVRDGTSFVPSPTTVLRYGDELLVVATDPVRDAAERRLRAVSQGGKLADWLGTSDESTRRPKPPRRSASPASWLPWPWQRGRKVARASTRGGLVAGAHVGGRTRGGSDAGGTGRTGGKGAQTGDGAGADRGHQAGDAASATAGSRSCEHGATRRAGTGRDRTGRSGKDHEPRDELDHDRNETRKERNETQKSAGNMNTKRQ
ncbi:potassium/proton antiporter [Streptomyces zagrosensis]|uniref:Cell volume regulation protein A n=1 Tax=Streptomyces zagrosensis TaxID=1042984 RepID=A0A7W9V2D0_9ACTN|nr:potassium/proton antiporter [Streptomyces zagrosensis]MBB5939812.1 cell volume regulation protein A [Streptomyces zagrosensis]